MSYRKFKFKRFKHRSKKARIRFKKKIRKALKRIGYRL